MSVKTVSLETAQKLKEAGFKPKTFFYWTVIEGKSFLNSAHAHTVETSKEYKGSYYPLETIYQAPSTDELFEELPKILNGFELRIIGSIAGWWDVCYWEHGNEDERRFKQCRNRNLIEALSAMWLWLKKESLI